MIILEAVIHETVWGGNRLNTFAERDHAGTDAVKTGHLYLLNGHKGLSNRVLNGVHAGATLEQIFPIEKRNWGMEEYGQFPLTIALVDARENLSIQVHPDAPTAERLEHETRGKTESYIFLEEPADGWIYAGCTCGSGEELETAVDSGRMERAAARLPVRKGDYVCVEAGTLHALTAGSLAYEIEYGSDFTYRFYDYNRVDELGKTRELHIPKALESIHLDRAPVTLPCKPGEWIQEENYEICRMQDRCFYKNSGEQIECISILKGFGECDGIPVRPGMAVILLPGEMMTDATLTDMVAARLRKGRTDRGVCRMDDRINKRT